MDADEGYIYIYATNAYLNPIIFWGSKNTADLVNYNKVCTKWMMIKWMKSLNAQKLMTENCLYLLKGTVSRELRWVLLYINQKLF